MNSIGSDYSIGSDFRKSRFVRASIYGKKKFKFLLALLDPKNQQKSIQYLQSGKKTLNYSSLDPPYFDQFVPSLKMLIFGGKIW